METGFRILLLTALLATLAGCASWRHKKSPPPPSTQSVPAQSPDEAPPRVVEPEVARREIKVPKIRSSNIEVGFYYGELSIEDFGAHPVYGFTAAYHITEDFFFQAEAGRSKAGKTVSRSWGATFSCLPRMRGASRITTCHSATTSCRARPFSVVASP